MIELNLPPYAYKLKQNNGSVQIWDAVRRKYVALTPEEWVRQHFIAYLVGSKKYPLGRIGNEISLSLNGRSRRCDTLVYDAEGQPLVLIEYKAPHISVSQKYSSRLSVIIYVSGYPILCYRMAYRTTAVVSIMIAESTVSLQKFLSITSYE